jgi:hypothetical protein
MPRLGTVVVRRGSKLGEYEGRASCCQGCLDGRDAVGMDKRRGGHGLVVLDTFLRLNLVSLDSVLMFMMGGRRYMFAHVEGM